MFDEGVKLALRESRAQIDLVLSICQDIPRSLTVRVEAKSKKVCATIAECETLHARRLKLLEQAEQAELGAAALREACELLVDRIHKESEEAKRSALEALAAALGQLDEAESILERHTRQIDSGSS